MTVEYRFLRFEIVGITTILYTTIVISPIIFDGIINFVSSNVSAALAFVGALFLFSIPLGYIIHQFAVNIHRSPKEQSTIFDKLDRYVQEKIITTKDTELHNKYKNLKDMEKNSFLTALLDAILHYERDAYFGNIYDRIEVRWSHFYARKAVGKYAPLASGAFTILLILIFSSTTDWVVLTFTSVVTSFGIWLIILIFSLIFIHGYSKKILLEIDNLERIIFLSKKKEIDKIIVNVIKEQFE